jgi:hypothetical protein
MYYVGIFLKGLSKTNKYLSQDNWRTGRDSNRAPPEYKLRMLPLDRLVVYLSRILVYLALKIKCVRNLMVIA